jgi:glycosyltransferase involved in cell wall biosynthesis
VTALPNYPERQIGAAYRGCLYRRERINGIEVHRSWLRVRPAETFLDKALYELTFAGLSLPSALRRAGRFETVVCVVPSLLAAALASSTLRRGRRLVVWLQDLVVGAAASLDEVGGPGRLALQAAAAVERRVLRSADRVICCSPGFASYAKRLGAPADRVETVLNWVDVERFSVESDVPPTGEFVAGYTGNVGYTQGFETIIEAARLLEVGSRIEVVGAGNSYERLRRAAAGVPSLTLRPLVPEADFPARLASYGALVVVQRAVSANVNLPSKIATYLAAGRPVVASIDPLTSAAELLGRSGAAILVPPEDGDALARAIRTLRADPRLASRLGDNGRRFAAAELDRRILLPRLEAAILGVAA